MAIFAKNLFIGPKIPIIRNGLALYLDATIPTSYPRSGTTWSDISGNNKNFSWVSSPSFTFDGMKSYFSTLGNRCIGPASNSFGITNTSGYTIFIACLQNSLTANAAVKFYTDGGGIAGRGISIHLSWFDGVIYFDQGGCCGTDTRLNIPSGGTNTWNIWAFRRFTGSSTRHIIKNGVTIATNSSSAADLNLNSTGVDLGSSDEFGANSSNWDARLNSFFVYNRGLSDEEVQQNFNALRGRFGI